LELQGDDYVVFASSQANSAIVSPVFGQLPTTAQQVFAAGQKGENSLSVDIPGKIFF
jgi:hypothetical protein